MLTHARIESPNRIVIHKILQDEVRHEGRIHQVDVPYKNPRQAKAADIVLVGRCPNVFTIGKMAAVDTDNARYRKALVSFLVISSQVCTSRFT